MKLYAALKMGIALNMLVFAFLIVSPLSTAYADCELNYGGGETCTYRNPFRIEKKVRIEGDSSWKDKVKNVKKGDTIEFQTKIKNQGDVDVDNMKMKVKLPDELYRTGGSGLTESWNDFSVGETKAFRIEAKVDSEEFDKKNFEKCVVIKAEFSYDGNFVGSDTATVCYSNGNLIELPKTGASGTVAFFVGGLMLIVYGFNLRAKVA